MKLRDVLTFHLAPVQRDDSSNEGFKQSDAFSQSFIRQLGLKVDSGCWADIDLNSPQLPEFINEVNKLISQDKAEFYGFNFLRQTVIEDVDTTAEWYQLVGSSKFDSNLLRSGIVTCKAYQMPTGVHVASEGWYNQFVSESFRRVVEENQLSGIEFVWVKDLGKYKAPQWYIPVAINALGRGVDHPWFDPVTLKGSDSYQPTDSKWRTGAWNFKMDQLRSDIKFDNLVHQEIIDLFRMCQDHPLSIIASRAFLRAFLPPSDFAFVWRREDAESDGKKWKSRGLCVNARTKDILLRHRLISLEDLEAIQILDEPPHGCQLLDGTAPVPEPYFSPEELLAVRKNLEKDWDSQLTTYKPSRDVSLKQALWSLRRAKKKHPEDYHVPAPKTEIFRLPFSLPENWMSVLAVSNGCILNDECTLLPVNELIEFREEKQALVASLFDTCPFEAEYIPIGSCVNGDWFSIEANPVGLDSKVFRVSHEDLSIVSFWENVPVFISDMLSGYYE